MSDALLLHRLHFAFTITYRYLFPQLTMGLVLLIVILKTIVVLRHSAGHWIFHLCLSHVSRENCRNLGGAWRMKKDSHAPQCEVAINMRAPWRSILPGIVI